MNIKAEDKKRPPRLNSYKVRPPVIFTFFPGIRLLPPLAITNPGIFIIPPYSIYVQLLFFELISPFLSR